LPKRSSAAVRSVGVTLLTIALLTRKDEQYTAAEEQYRRALRILEKTLGPAHEQTAFAEARSRHFSSWQYYAEHEPAMLAEPKLITTAGKSIARDSLEIHALERRFETGLAFPTRFEI